MLFSRSRQLRLAGFVCALALAGCGGGGHSSSGGPGSGYFSWYIFDIEDVQYAEALSCDVAGAGSVVVTLTNQSSGYSYPQAPVLCAAGEIITTEVPAGPYTLTFDLYGDPTIYGDAPLLDTFTTGETFHIGGGLVDFRGQTYAPFQIRSFILGWDIYYRSVLSSCAAVGATYVDLDFTVTGTSTIVTSRFACIDGDPSSGGLGVGSFAIPYSAASATWQLYLLDAAAQELQMIDGGAAVAIPAAGDVNLGYQVFSL
jgi:hypothetical protein